MIITIFNLIFKISITSYNLFKSSRTTHKNLLTPEIQTCENKKEILSRVNSTIWCTRLIELNIVTVNYGSSRDGNEISEEVLNPGFVVYALIVSGHHFEDGNNILMFICIEIVYQMHIVCQFFNNLVDNFVLN
jgi:hypothetical protein